MRLPKFEYLDPKTIEEACSLLSQHGDKARLIAGGTDLLIIMKHKEVTPEYLVGLKGIPNLDSIDADADGVRIGALATLRSIGDSAVVRERFPFLADIAGKMATHQIRNMGTIGGNICNAAPSADTAPSLICLGAKAKLVGPKKERIVAVEEFFTGPGETVLKAGEILTEIQVPNQPAHTGGAYLRLTRLSIDLAVVGVAALVTLEGKGGSCKEARIALGAVAPTPIRAKKAEGVITGKKIEDSLIEEAARIASAEARPITDVRGSAPYRTDIVRVLTKRAIGQALEQAK
ncbi:MAG: xanthine dehydrogenase family protein subunit M [Desulfobacteraceae bacterium]|jgi:carbon-monoxide dehydrogenase medium subunit